METETIWAVSDSDDLAGGNVDFHGDESSAEQSAIDQAEYYHQEYFVIEVNYKVTKRTTMTLEDYE